MKLSNEAKVGGLVISTAGLALFFGWLIGLQNPFSKNLTFYLTYNFAGGIEVGSPVRVSGIKVGRVEKIEFFAPYDSKTISIQEPGSDTDMNAKEYSPVKLKISIMKDATRGVKHDSRFYINLAGIIGERYIEVTPGSRMGKPVAMGDVIAGVDPPRIDQLISQSFDLAGKIAEVIENSKGDIVKSVELLYKLSGNLNTTLQWVDKSNLFKTDLARLIDNLITITTDVKSLTKRVNTPEGEKTLKLLYDLLWRLEPLDGKQIKVFLQKEGIKTTVGVF